MAKNITVTKRDNTKETFDADKIHRIINWAIEGLEGVSLSEIEMAAEIKHVDNITTKEIHETLVEAAFDLISEENPDYQFVAGRLLNYSLRKDVWGGKNPPKLIDHLNKNIKRGVYTPDLLKWYSVQEINKMDEFIDHDRDMHLSHASVKQAMDKYLQKDRSTGEIYETLQFAYILIAATAFHKYEPTKRMIYIKRFYNFISKHKINLPTPVLGEMRSNTDSFASCLLAEVDDTMKSIFANVSAVGLATGKGYGIGLNFAKIRAKNASIRNGKIVHTGKIPFLKMYESATKCSQKGGIRGGGGTVFFNIFDTEILDLITLKNNAGTEETRARRLDYAVCISKLFYERLMKNEDFSLFSSHECPELYSSFGMPEFDDLYKKAEKRKDLKFKTTISAREFFSQLTKERVETGRIYILNIDHANSHSPWLDQVKMSNLCMEILQPTVPIQDLNDSEGFIGVCILSGINWLEIKSIEEMEKVCDVIVRFLDEVIDYQSYFCPAAENFATKRRSLGVGITNLAAYLAKNNLGYEDKEAPQLVADMMEQQQYFLLKASANLAKEKGQCVLLHKTKYWLGVELPIDNYKKDKVDEFVSPKLKLDWEELRELIKTNGLRHSTVTACMPCESSSILQNSTNGIEPIRSLITVKGSKTNRVKVVAPNIKSWKNRYTLAFDMKSNAGYLKIAAAIQKFCDMAISINVYYNYAHYPENRIPDAVVMKDMLYSYSLGNKTCYYVNTPDGDSDKTLEKVEELACSSGACTL